MEQRINKNMRSVTVLHTAYRLGIPENELWEMFYESGIDYIEELKVRVKRKRIFDAIFKKLLINPKFGEMNVSAFFETVRNSQAFWFWWSVQLWTVCQNELIENKQELGYSLQLIDALIPHFILNQIFHGEQKPKCRQRTQGLSATKAVASEPAKRKTRKGIRSGI